MNLVIEYYIAPQSPWAYLGHQRLQDIAAAAGATIELRPADFGRIFAGSGGLPLPKRAPQRLAYRLVELRRFSQQLGLALNPQPTHFPVPGDDAARLIIAVQQHDGTAAALALTGALMRALWVQDRHIADPATLAALLAEQGLAAQRLTDASAPAVQQAYEANTDRAIELNVFGAPSYVIAGELFWGQDRLDFVERCLAEARLSR
jgi:2-hydroxychromene-2-carboxylate isomerase